MSETSGEDARTTVADERAIERVILGYARAVDRLDRDGIAAAFHPDAGVRIGSLRTTGRMAPEAIVEALQACERSAHFVTNLLVDIAGDQGGSEAYVRALQLIRRDGRLYTRELISRWLDRLERRQGRWAISERVAVYEWSRIDPVVEEMAVTDDWPRAERSRADPSYRLFSP